MRSNARRVGWLAMVLVAGCGAGPVPQDGSTADTATPPDVAAADGSVMDAASADAGGTTQPVRCSGATPTFAAHVVPIVMRSCAGSEICHGSFGGASGIYGQFVNVAAERDNCTGRIRVVPGDLEQSYLVHKLTGVAMCPDSQRMPLGSPLPAVDIQTIADWICAGALDN